VKVILGSLLAVLIVLLVTSGMAFVRGSLEMFATEEQMSKARLVYGGVFAVSVVLALLVLRRVKGDGG